MVVVTSILPEKPTVQVGFTEVMVFSHPTEAEAMVSLSSWMALASVFGAVIMGVLFLTWPILLWLVVQVRYMFVAAQAVSTVLLPARGFIRDPLPETGMLFL